MTATTTAKRPQGKRGMSRDTKRAILMWLILLPLAFIIIIPLLYMFSMAFTTEANQFILPIRWIPIPPRCRTFRRSLPTRCCLWPAGLPTACWWPVWAQ